MPFHVTRLENSKMLQRVKAFLDSRGARGATGLEIALECDVLNPATVVSHLRHEPNNIPVECEHVCTTEQGRHVYRYWIAKQEAAA